jgi:hypothetical protein
MSAPAHAVGMLGIDISDDVQQQRNKTEAFRIL